jgi:hypothetical protein
VVPETPARTAARASGAPAAGTGPPASWTAALPFWRNKPAEIGPDLAAHLAAHPYDLLAARAVLRTPGPGDVEMLDRAEAVLQESPSLESIGQPGSDAIVVRLRAARGLLSSSWRAALAALGPVDASGLAEELTRRRFRRADVDAAVADVARIAAPASSAALREAAVALLEDRNPDTARALRRELARQDQAEPPRAFRLVQGRPAPYRPRDLDWSVVMLAVALEESR